MQLYPGSNPPEVMIHRLKTKAERGGGRECEAGIQTGPGAARGFLLVFSPRRPGCSARRVVSHGKAEAAGQAWPRSDNLDKNC
uniref:Uncharacterized protein n=1 Tax=Sphaerodactylus townsendi TaxID=933632 RepID=A0ACB8EQV1_9SAUR